MKLIYLYRRFRDQGNLDVELAFLPKALSTASVPCGPVAPCSAGYRLFADFFDQEKVRDVGGALWTAF